MGDAEKVPVDDVCDEKGRAGIKDPRFQALRGIGIHAFPVFGTEALARVLGEFQASGDVMNPHTGEVQHLGQKFHPADRDVVDVTAADESLSCVTEKAKHAEAVTEVRPREGRRRRGKKRPSKINLKGVAPLAHAETHAGEKCDGIEVLPQATDKDQAVEATPPAPPPPWLERPAEKWRWMEEGDDVIAVTVNVTEADASASRAMPGRARASDEVREGDVTVKCTARSMALRVERPQSGFVHTLRLSNLAGPIDPSKSQVKCTSTAGGSRAVTVRLRKAAPANEWGPNLTTRPDAILALR